MSAETPPRYPGRYSDGRTAASREVVVSLAADGLAIREDGTEVATWAWREVGVIEPRPDRPVRLASARAPDARLTIPDPAALAVIQARLGAAPMRAGRSPLWTGVAAVIGTALVLWGLYAALPVVARPLAQMVPPAWETTWGRHVVDSLAVQYGACRGADGQRALERLVAALAPPGTDQRFHIRALEVPAINALAAPGGQIVLLSGLIADARSPNELAAVVAHEMAHVLERHVTAAMIRHVGIGVLAAWITGDPSGFLAGAGSMLAAMSYTRADEAAADARALELLRAAGIGTEGIATFFARLAEHQMHVPELLSTHPASEDRAEAAAAIPGRDALTEAEWRAVKRMCE